MKKYDLSILIPARNEEWLSHTVNDILKNKEGNTEIIIALDGEWANPPVEDHEDVTIIKFPVSIGQRAATNQACRLSNAKYVMKVDAHCAFDKGFDVKMMKDMQEDWTMIPVMKNLHVFDYVCKTCGERWYQGRIPTECKNEKCKGKEFERDVVWRPKPSPNSTAYRLDKTLHFQYWGGYKKFQQGDLVETMTIQGSCFMLTRKKYWELDICSEQFNSWGQQGAEVALKTWLSGGRVICNKKTWYAHLFRTQKGGFSFPYHNPESLIQQNRELSRDLFVNDKWDKATRKFQWLLDKFNPPEWGQENKGIIFYSDCRLPTRIGRRVKNLLLDTGLPISSCSLKPMKFGDNYYLPLERGYLTMFIQMLIALKRSKAEIVFFCEHDVLYHPSHFAFNPPDKNKFYYNTNVWKTDGQKAYRVDDCKQVSGICVYRKTAVEHYTRRIAKIQKEGFSMKMGFEPATHGRAERVDDLQSETWESAFPNIDIRHNGNLTKTRWSPDQFRNKKYTKGWKEATEIEGWGHISKII